MVRNMQKNSIAYCFLNDVIANPIKFVEIHIIMNNDVEKLIFRARTFLGLRKGRWRSFVRGLNECE